MFLKAQKKCNISDGLHFWKNSIPAPKKGLGFLGFKIFTNWKIVIPWRFKEGEMMQNAEISRPSGKNCREYLLIRPYGFITNPACIKIQFR